MCAFPWYWKWNPNMCCLRQVLNEGKPGWGSTFRHRYFGAAAVRFTHLHGNQLTFNTNVTMSPCDSVASEIPCFREIKAWVRILGTDNYMFWLYFFSLLFLSFLLSVGVLFWVLHIQFYLFSNQSIIDTPFWYHSFKKTKPPLSFLRRLSVFFLQIHVGLVSVENI